ncbi:membrane protein involved in the export of O-antigen and teichoic acid [Belliella baltica DSM 15883]|uniref:Membrane protein involved in the export of O-antigen and teichoic acid n=1 Tax=Belliella baltica (strain DSM 15883 / CIP 108006 / LMG 21964 / BA134) TaxID=866536 RepID=I3Z2U6_BELBD|nr:oligosaccharide flippase family protein [Belliella baltica]AFL83564.1 membrane protein involved in the export of O-antigen and teichoic acid [Belliella baltica DSM 15883]
MLEKISPFPFINLFRNKSIQNFIFLAIIQASNVLISLISMPLLIQGIGVDQFGFVNLALSVVVLANIFVSFGFNLSAPRDVAINQKNNTELSHLVSNIFSGKIILATIASAIILIAIFGFNLFQEYQIILIFSLLMLFSEATMPLWFFQGMEKMKLISIANIFSKLLFLMGIVLFIHSPDQSKWVNFLLGGAGFSINILLLLYIHYELDITFYKPRLRQVFNSIKSNTLFFFSLLASHISVNGGLIILSFFANSNTLGMFSLAEKIGLVLRMFPALVIQAVYPNASKLYQNDKEKFYRFCIKIAGWALLIGTFISLATYFLAPIIIKVLSKKELPEAVSFLKVLAFVPFLACLNNINVILFLAKNQKNLMFNSSWLMCLYMILASITLTHYYGGVGLSFALISTELFVFFICIALNLKHNKREITDIFNILINNKR